MSTSWRKLATLCGEALAKPDFEKELSVADTAGVKALFQSKTLTFDPNGTSGFWPLHNCTALTNAANAVLRHLRAAAGAAEPLPPLATVQQEDEVLLLWKFLACAVASGGEAVTAVIEDALVRSVVELTYATSRPQQHNIANCEMFFIDGDALLMAALSSQHVDWDLVQPLHVIYNAQKLLLSLHERGARFHVVFFRSQTWLWEKAPQKLLLRECLRLTLQHAAALEGAESPLIVHEFDGFDDPAFAAHVTRHDPEYFVISDGEQLAAPTPLQAQFHLHAEQLDNQARTERLREYRSLVEDAADTGARAALYYRCMLLWAAARRMKVAFSSRVLIRENRAIVFVVGLDSHRFGRALAMEKDVLALARSLQAPVALPAVAAPASDVPDAPVRVRVVAAALRAYLAATAGARSETETALAQTLAVAAYSAGLLDAAARAQQPAVSPEVTAFLNAVSPYVAAALPLYVGAAGELGRAVLDGSEYDVIDGHLLATLTHYLPKHSLAELLGTTHAAAVAALWAEVAAPGKDALPATDKPWPAGALPTIAFTPVLQSIDYPHFSHELVKQLAGSFAVQGFKADRPYPEGYGNANKLSGWSISLPFDDLNDVVDTEMVALARAEAAANPKRKSELETNFVSDAGVRAESMGVKGFASEELTIVVEDNNAASGGKPKKEAKKSQKAIEIAENNIVLKMQESLDRGQQLLRVHEKNLADVLDSNVADTKSSYADDVKAAIARIKHDVETELKKLDRGGYAERSDPNPPKDALPLRSATWRLIVLACGDLDTFGSIAAAEPSFAAAVRKSDDDKGSGKDREREHKVFGLLRTFIDGNFGASNWRSSTGATSAAITTAGVLKRLRSAFADPKDAAKYVYWVYGTYMSWHMQLRLMACLLRLDTARWNEERETSRTQVRPVDRSLGIRLFTYVHYEVLELLKDTNICAGDFVITAIRSALRFFDFSREYLDRVDKAMVEWRGAALMTTSVPESAKHAVLGETPEMFQLMHMGHLLRRPVSRFRDPRINFRPDQWQRDLLDLVDRRESAIVCAPTSAGKTFISFYCMLNALKTSNSKVVVYLAPNRALINQAVADVYARFGSKPYPQSLARRVFGVHGGDSYHMHHDNCQVLITLPEILETLLLSPKYEAWTQRLDYVILDEIHTMETGKGDVYERVLALLPCPFVALSATLGETEQLSSWLNNVQARLVVTGDAGKKEQAADSEQQQQQHHRVQLIPLSGSIQRWNDLKKYIYLPPPGYQPKFTKATDKVSGPLYIKDLHPLSFLSVDLLYNGFPPDISLVPSEVVTLYNSMWKHFSATMMTKHKGLPLVETMALRMGRLKPELYFSQVTYITQAHARQYESDVKEVFVQWVTLSRNGSEVAAIAELAGSEEKRAAFAGNMLKVCQDILGGFSVALRAEEAALDAYAIEAAAQQQRTGAVAAAACFPDSHEFIALHMVNLLRELRSRDMGPTIVFSFESEDCNDLVRAVVERLEEAEAAYRKTPEFAAYAATVAKNAVKREAMMRQQQSNAKAQSKLVTDEEGNREKVSAKVDAGAEIEWTEGDWEIPEVLPEFTFLDRSEVSEAEVQSYINACVRDGDELAARAIKRGVGIHHAGMKGRLRRHMEILFRKRRCGVIFSTETLALGVHSPCRSVVLAGDHALLDTTQLRQMMGRAGRRGLDFIGHVIFVSISMKRITRLMTRGMTVIKGNVQLDALSQLRLLQLYDFRDHRRQRSGGRLESAGAKKKTLQLIERLYVNPLYFAGRAGVEGGNLEPFNVLHLQMLLGFFHREGLHFADRPSSMGSLLVDVLNVFRNAQVGREGFGLVHMLTRGVFRDTVLADDYAHLADGPSEVAGELLAYLFTKLSDLPLELHRSALSDPAVVEAWDAATRSSNTRAQHRVVLAPLSAFTGGARPLDYFRGYRVVSAFYTYLAGLLREPAEATLPYAATDLQLLRTLEDVPLSRVLRATAIPFAARSPFVALSGCGDRFLHGEDLCTTLRRGLYCDPQMLPFSDLVDGCRHDGAQVLINACLADFVRCRAQVDAARGNYHFTWLERYNGLSQSDAYAVLSQAEHVLSNLAGLVRPAEKPQLRVLQALYGSTPSTTMGVSALLGFAAELHGLRNQIDKNLALDKLLKQKEEARRLAGKKDTNVPQW